MGGGGVADDGVAGGTGVAGLERGERRSSLSFSSSIPRRSSASLRRLRTRLAGGGIASDGDREGADTQAVVAASGDGVAAEAVHNGVTFTRAGTAAYEDSGCRRDWFRQRRWRLERVAFGVGEYFLRMAESCSSRNCWM
jgi:hypothetical protein